MDWFYIVEVKNRGLVALPEITSNHNPIDLLSDWFGNPILCVWFNLVSQVGPVAAYKNSTCQRLPNGLNLTQTNVKCAVCFVSPGSHATKTTRRPRSALRWGVKHFWARLATIDRKEKKKNTWGRTSRLKNDGCFIGYVSDRVTCPFFGSFFFSWNKARQGERGSGSSRNMFYFFFQYWSKIAASFPSTMFFGTWCAGWELSALSSFHRQPPCCCIQRH